MKLFLSGFILVFFISCSGTDNSEDVINFSSPELLNGSRILGSEAGFLSVNFIDSLLIISTRQHPAVKVYDTRENLVADFGTFGRGPGEFENPPRFSEVYKADGSYKTSIYSIDLRQYLSIDITRSILRDSLTFGEAVTLPRELSSTLDLFYLESSNYLGMYDDRLRMRLNHMRGAFIYNSASDEYTLMDTYNLDYIPENLESVPNGRMTAVNLNTRIPVVSTDRTKTAFLLTFYPMIELYSLPDGKRREYLLGKQIPDQPVEINRETMLSLTRFSATGWANNKHIYILYYGEKPYRADFTPREFDSSIKVIDWEGNPVKQFTIPAEYQLDDITVDEENGFIYGLSHGKDELYKFEYSL